MILTGYILRRKQVRWDQANGRYDEIGEYHYYNGNGTFVSLLYARIYDNAEFAKNKAKEIGHSTEVQRIKIKYC